MSGLASFLSSPPPSVGVEIASDRVTAVTLAKQAAGWIVAAHATERIAAGVITPALNATNVHDARALAAAVRSVFDKLGGRPRRVALVIPDTAAKLSLLRFDKVPNAADLDQLIRWQMRKAAPFKPEEAQISWVPAAPIPEGGREYLVTLARIDVIDSYMRACADAGAAAGVVDLASLNLVNATLAKAREETGDTLVVHVASDYATLAIVRGGYLIFFRTRQLDASSDLADLVHQTAMYHEDRLGGQRFARVILCGGSRATASEAGGRAGGIRVGKSLGQEIEERMGVSVEPFDFRPAAAMRDRIAASPDLLDTLAPAVGVVLRELVA
jgi:type IV pilus assembly protein PilM